MRVLNGDRLPRWADFCIAVAILATGAEHCYIYRHEIVTPDGISYADLADRYVAGLWSQTVNGHWSRLYPFVLSIPMRFFHPARSSESIYFHLIGFCFFAIALVAFRRLLSEIMKWQQIERAELSTMTWSRQQFLLLGYMLFVYVMRMVSPRLVTPDLGVAAVAIAVAALLLRITRVQSGYGNALLLGVLLGAGYLLKSVFMVVGTCCIVALFALLPPRQRLRIVGTVTVTFFAIAAPNIIALSVQQGKITFGESGRLVYMWHVDGTSYVHLDPRGNIKGEPIHATRRIYERPNAYEYATPITGTYAPWLDPAYWQQGLSPVFDLRRQLVNLGVTSRYYVSALILRKGPLLLLIAILLIKERRSRIRHKRKWWLWAAPSLIPFALYWILFVEDRYIGGFLLVVCVLALGSVQLPDRAASGRWFSLATVTTVAIISAWIGIETVREAYRPVPDVQREVAETVLSGHYLSEGDTVACIGYCFDVYWARLAHLRVIAEVPAQITAANAALGPIRTSVPTDADEFWWADVGTRESVLRALAKTTAKGVVAIDPPNGSDLRGWTRIGETKYYFRELTP
jgi:hypothetical protein